MLGAIVLLILTQPDLGTAASIVMIAAVMIFAAGISYRYIAALALMAAAGAVLPALDLRVPLAPGQGLPRIRGPTRSATATR